MNIIGKEQKKTNIQNANLLAISRYNTGHKLGFAANIIVWFLDFWSLRTDSGMMFL